MSWVVVKYEKMRFLATLRRATFNILLFRGSAIGTLLNVTLLVMLQTKGFILRMQIFRIKQKKTSDAKIIVFAAKPLLGKRAQRGQP